MLPDDSRHEGSSSTASPYRVRMSKRKANLLKNALPSKNGG